MNEPHMSVGIAQQPAVSPPGTMTPVGIMLSIAIGDGCQSTSIIITKETARSIAKVLIGLADDMDATAPSPRPGSVVVVQP